MLLSFTIATGVGFACYLHFVVGRYIYRKGEENGHLDAYKFAREEYKNTIHIQKMKLIKYESVYRDPKEGNQEWIMDFSKYPVEIERGKVMKVNRYIHGVTVEFQRKDDEKPLTGTVTHITVIVPEYPQEC